MTARKKAKHPRRADSLPDRDVLIRIVPYRSDRSRIGVLIQKSSRGETRESVITPDEARYPARDEAEDRIRAKLLTLADFIDAPREDLARQNRGQVEVVPLTIRGPEALRAWLMMHRESWQAGYRLSQERGWPLDVVVIGSLRSERLDEPPVGFDLRPREAYRREIALRLPSLTDTFAGPPPAGYSHCFATSANGRFQGSLEAMLAVSEPTVTLPDVDVNEGGL